MKKIFVASVALASVLASIASPALAAPPRHRAPVAHDTMAPFDPSTGGRFLSRQADVVMLNGRIIGEDPDPAIRTQILRDPAPSDY